MSDKAKPGQEEEYFLERIKKDAQQCFHELYGKPEGCILELITDIFGHLSSAKSFKELSEMFHNLFMVLSLQSGAENRSRETKEDCPDC